MLMKLLCVSLLRHWRMALKDERFEVIRFKAAAFLQPPVEARAEAAGEEESGETLLIDGKVGAVAVSRANHAPSRDGKSKISSRPAASGANAAADAMSAATAAAALGDPGDWDMNAAPTVRLFVLGRRLRVSAIRDALRSTMVPPGFTLAADEEIEFGMKPKGSSSVGVGVGELPDDIDDDDDDDEEEAGERDEDKEVTKTVRVVIEVDDETRNIRLIRTGDGMYRAFDITSGDGNGDVGSTPPRETQVLRLFEGALYVRTAP